MELRCIAECAAGTRGTGVWYSQTDGLWYRYVAGVDEVVCISVADSHPPRFIVGTPLTGLIYTVNESGYLNRFIRYTQGIDFKTTKLIVRAHIQGQFLPLDLAAELHKILPPNAQVGIIGGIKSGLLLVGARGKLTGYSYRIKGSEITLYPAHTQLPFEGSQILMAGESKVGVAVVDSRFLIARIGKQRGWNLSFSPADERQEEILGGKLAMTCLSNSTPGCYTGSLRGLLLSDGKMYQYTVDARSVELTDLIVQGEQELPDEHAVMVGSSCHGLIWINKEVYSYDRVDNQITYKYLKVSMFAKMVWDDDF